MRLLPTKFDSLFTGFVCCNVLFACLISLRYFWVHQVADSPLGILFSIVYTLGHIGLLVSILAMLIWTLTRLLSHDTHKWLLAIVVFGLGSALLIADTFVYQQYRFHLNGMVWDFFFAGGDEVISFPVYMWLLIGLFIATLFVIQWLLAKASDYPILSNIKRKYVLGNGFLCLLAGHMVFAYADATFNNDVTLQRSYLPLSFPTTAKSFFTKLGIMDIEAYKLQKKLAGSEKIKGLNYPLKSLKFPEIDNKPNVLFIVIDSWRADMMNESITPNIYRFAQSAINYGNHFSGSNNTRHGMFSLFYGLPGNYWEAFLKNQKGPILVDAFNWHDYQSQIFSSAKLTMPEFDLTLYKEVNNLRTYSTGNSPWQRDKDAAEGLITWFIKHLERPKFSLLMLDAAHGFSVPDDYPKVFQPSLDEPNYMALDDDYEPTEFLNLYKNAVHYNDFLIGKVLNAIENDLDNTIVVITGDHGKEFNENQQGFWGHNSNYSWHQTAVPMLIHWPGKNINEINSLTSHFDVVPTLMSEVFKLHTPYEEYSVGQSLFDPIDQSRSVFLGRNHYYAIRGEKRLYEVDRWGNFQIKDNNYQVLKEEPLNRNVINQALADMVKFNK